MTTICHSNMFLHRMLTESGAYIHKHHPDSFEDIGDSESGPQLAGGPAFDMYSGDTHEIIVEAAGLIVAMIDIDWDEWRFFNTAGMLSPDPDDDDPLRYRRPRHTGEDFIVSYRDEEGTWFACDSYGWTDDPKERGYFHQAKADQIAHAFNNAPKDRLTGMARVAHVEPESAKTDTSAEKMIQAAKQIIAACETDLHRNLSRGEKIDLLCDNTRWPSDTCRAIVAKL